MEAITKTLREEILEYLDAVGCARSEDIVERVGRSVKATYFALEKLVRRGYITQKIDRGDRRRRIYCINREKMKIEKIEPREVTITA